MTLFGVDISNWQRGLDLAAVQREGFRAVIAKVSEGTGFRDTTWPGFRDAARALGLPIMGYHYLRSTASIEAQADTFVQHLGDKSIPCMIDAELGSGGVTEISAFRDAVEARGVRCALLYLPRWYWSGHIGSPDLRGLPPLMSSSYGPGTGRAGYASAIYPGDQDSGWTGYGGLPIAVFQFTEKARVAGQSIDAWAWRGTTAELNALFGAGKDDTMSDAQLIKDQLSGVGGKGWPILGRAVETDPDRDRYLVEAIATILTQLAGGPNFEGWPQLGDGPDSATPRRTLVDGIAHVKLQNDRIIALLEQGAGDTEKES